MRKQIGYVALVIAVGILVWSFGFRKRTEEELNSVYYPILFSEVIRAVDQDTKQAVDFRINWLEEVSPSLKGTEPTRVLKYPDKSQVVMIIRRGHKKTYSFEIVADGYKPHQVTFDRAEWFIDADVGDVALVFELVPDPNATKK